MCGLCLVGQSDPEQVDSTGKDSDDETETDGESGPLCHEKCKKKPRKINCLLTKNLKENHEYWVAKIQEEEKQKASNDSTNEISQVSPSNQWNLTSNSKQPMEAHKSKQPIAAQESKEPMILSQLKTTNDHK